MNRIEWFASCNKQTDKLNESLLSFNFVSSNFAIWCANWSRVWEENVVLFEHGILIIPKIIPTKCMHMQTIGQPKKCCAKQRQNQMPHVCANAVSTRAYILCNAYALNSDDVLFSSRFRHFSRCCCCFTRVNLNIQMLNNKHSMALRCSHARTHLIVCSVCLADDAIDRFRIRMDVSRGEKMWTALQHAFPHAKPI